MKIGDELDNELDNEHSRLGDDCFTNHVFICLRCNSSIGLLKRHSWRYGFSDVQVCHFAKHVVRRFHRLNCDGWMLILVMQFQEAGFANREYARQFRFLHACLRGVSCPRISCAIETDEKLVYLGRVSVKTKFQYTVIQSFRGSEIASERFLETDSTRVPVYYWMLMLMRMRTNEFSPAAIRCQNSGRHDDPLGRRFYPRNV
jgi:hypothetical protein